MDIASVLEGRLASLAIRKDAGLGQRFCDSYREAVELQRLLYLGENSSLEATRLTCQAAIAIVVGAVDSDTTSRVAQVASHVLLGSAPTA